MKAIGSQHAGTAVISEGHWSDKYQNSSCSFKMLSRKRYSYSYSYSAS